MGNVKRIRKAYQGPAHPWIRSRIESEREIKREYGLKNKKEIWKMESILRNAASNAKRLIAGRSEQSKLEKEQLLARMRSMGLLTAGAKLEDILDLRIQSILDRRLQTLVYRKGLARSMGQARQFITHEHIQLDGKSITAPAYIVSSEEETTVSFSPHSNLASIEHPERVPITKKSKPRPAPKDDRFRGRGKRT
ncbi:30S ribosomal protein S4 [Candidatus Woesearchaeota archaeon]|nr:30S ribosomal protein S4 [Candidatus Woesearchaeota archaeon]